MSCVIELDICITRGADYAIDVGLSAAYTDVIGDPSAFEMQLNFREEQDDLLPVYLTLTAMGVVDANPAVGDPPILFSFKASATETSSLPPWQHVNYCDLVKLDGTRTDRLFEGDVEVND